MSNGLEIVWFYEVEGFIYPCSPTVILRIIRSQRARERERARDEKDNEMNGWRNSNVINIRINVTGTPCGPLYTQRNKHYIQGRKFC